MVPQSGKPQRKRLGDILVEAGVISGQQLQEALTKQKILGKRLGVKDFQMILCTILGKKMMYNGEEI